MQFIMLELATGATQASMTSYRTANFFSVVRTNSPESNLRTSELTLFNELFIEM